jgi:hypothetical protein
MMDRLARLRDWAHDNETKVLKKQHLPAWLGSLLCRCTSHLLFGSAGVLAIQASQWIILGLVYTGALLCAVAEYLRARCR